MDPCKHLAHTFHYFLQSKKFAVIELSKIGDVDGEVDGVYGLERTEGFVEVRDGRCGG